MPTPDEMKNHLIRSGWSVSETRTSFSWLVLGAHGERSLLVSAATRAEAWRVACRQAEDLGLLTRTEET